MSSLYIKCILGFLVSQMNYSLNSANSQTPQFHIQVDHTVA